MAHHLRPGVFLRWARQTGLSRRLRVMVRCKASAVVVTLGAPRDDVRTISAIGFSASGTRGRYCVRCSLYRAAPPTRRRPPGRLSACPPRARTHGEARSRTGTSGQPEERRRAGMQVRMPAGLSLPSWPCGFESRHPLPAPPQRCHDPCAMRSLVLTPAPAATRTCLLRTPIRMILDRRCTTPQ